MPSKKQRERQKMKHKPQLEPEVSSDEESSASDDNDEFDQQDQQAPSSASSSSDDSSQDESGEPFFTDENSKWLKPKAAKQKAAKLLESSDEEDGDSSDDSSGDDDNEKDELLEVEKEAQLLDEEMELEEKEAEQEMRRTVRDSTSIYHLPTVEELAKDVDRVVPPSEIRSHIDSILEVLSDFKERREAGRARKEYIGQLGAYISELHGYLPELVEYFLTMFGPAETLEFVNASDKPRPLVIRTNTLKTRRKDLAAALIKRGVSLDPLASWSKVGLKIVESPVPIGATPEYLSGMYMLQSAASMCPVLALSPQPKERVLDMSAAPGGKTSYMAQLMRNTGYIIANDLKADRQKATVANMHRLGVKNVICCAHDGRKLGKLYHNRFDRVLLDAPCSGLGVISRDPSVKVQRTLSDIHKTAHLQKEMLISAIDALKYKNTTGGFLVYSTCSVSVAENEQVVQYALSKRDVRLVETGLDFGTPGFVRYQERRFHPTMALTRRFYPHVHNMDGFFVAKLQKLSDKRPEDVIIGKDLLAEVDNEEEEAEPSAEATSSSKAEDDGGKKEARKNKRKRRKEDTVAIKKDANRSIPPPAIKQKRKQRTNAKVTKPRRNKAAAT